MRTRREQSYRDTESSDGRLNVKIQADVSDRIRRYCKRTNQNKAIFVSNCMSAQLDVLEKELLENLSKAELVEMIYKLMAER